jgi:hypothetical protein
MQGTLDISPLIIWVGALSVILSFGTAIWTIVSSPAKRNDSRIADLTKRCDVIELRAQRVEDAVGRLPSTDMMHRIEIAMARVEGHIDKLDERLKPVTATVERLQEWMLENGK